MLTSSFPVICVQPLFNDCYMIMRFVVAGIVLAYSNAVVPSLKLNVVDK